MISDLRKIAICGLSDAADIRACMLTYMRRHKITGREVPMYFSESEVQSNFFDCLPQNLNELHFKQLCNACLNFPENIPVLKVTDSNVTIIERYQHEIGTL